jgi:hypothetical protein
MRKGTQKKKIFNSELLILQAASFYTPKQLVVKIQENV